jgi:hypothetical protein
MHAPASAGNLVLGIALFGVRQNRGLGRARRVAGGVAVALVIAGDRWRRSRCCAADSANTRKP